MTVPGLTTLSSNHGPRDTMNRLETAVKAKGMTVFARIDHAAGADGVGRSLPPTELLIFGNANAGTPLMQSVRTIAIDLPLKALVWQEPAGATWLCYDDPVWLATRHGLDGTTAATIAQMTRVLDEVAMAATGGLTDSPPP